MNIVSKFYHLFILFFLVLFFLFTRLYNIEQVPQSLYWDEASIGMNAYSILETGRDEWGAFLPAHFKAFGEYKLPIYIYSVVIIEAFFGLNDLSVRIPAVLYSLGTILLVYLLVVTLFNDKRIALLSVFILIISPWFFIFSRTGYEVSAGLFYLLLGIFLFFKSFRLPPLLLLSSLGFLSAIYSYNSFRIIVPLIGLFLGFYALNQEGKAFFKNWKIVLLSLFLFLIGLLPIIHLYMSEDGLKRFDQVGIYQPGDSRKLALIQFGQNYIRHFDPYFLFLSGDQNLRSHTGEVGELYWIALPFILLGLYVVLKKAQSNYLFILFLLIISPVPAALTRESPHALRSLLMVMPFSILSALGIHWVCQKFKFYKASIGFIVMLFLLLFSIYFGKYLTTYSLKSGEDWQFGYKQLFSDYGSVFHNYDQVLVSDRYGQPYVYDAFYRKLDPNALQKNRILNDLPRSETSLVLKQDMVTYNNVVFEKISSGSSLVFAHPEEKIEDVYEKSVILFPDKTVAFYVYEIFKE